VRREDRSIEIADWVKHREEALWEALGRVKSNDNVTERGDSGAVPSNDNVTEPALSLPALSFLGL